MRKMNRSAFTLVELIVVITILAILATVAFISFGGQTTKAKNSKVVTDISSLASKVNLLSLDDTTVVKNTLTGSTNNNVDTTGTGAGVALSTAWVYGAGNINFFTLKEKKENFRDTSGTTVKDYVYAYVAKDNVNVFNVGGQTRDEAGAYTAVIKGTYYQAAPTDVASLLSDSGASTTPVINGAAAQLY